MQQVNEGSSSLPLFLLKRGGGSIYTFPLELGYLVYSNPNPQCLAEAMLCLVAGLASKGCQLPLQPPGAEKCHERIFTTLRVQC